MPLLVLISYILAEILAFAAIASWLGFGWAFLLMALLMITGTVLAGRGLQPRGGGRTYRVGTKAALVIAMLLSATPGFITSIIAFLLIAPPTRTALLTWMSNQLRIEVENITTRIYAASPMASRRNTYGSFSSFQRAEGAPRQASTSAEGRENPEVIDYSEIEDWARSVNPEDFGPKQK